MRRCLASYIARPLMADSAKSALERMAYARVYVEIDVNWDLPEFQQKVVYEWIPLTRIWHPKSGSNSANVDVTVPKTALSPLQNCDSSLGKVEPRIVDCEAIRESGSGIGGLNNPGSSSKQYEGEVMQNQQMVHIDDFVTDSIMDGIVITDVSSPFQGSKVITKNAFAELGKGAGNSHAEGLETNMVLPVNLLAVESPRNVSKQLKGNGRGVTKCVDTYRQVEVNKLRQSARVRKPSAYLK
ncbi:hypothetical protein LIER_15284 [Lithospermum erythrorhizon]|uniref:Uncharacterized protein n=1 Tax=Lithospermum erythrorhizon TaxID=34254 RepID=A0AAV3Q5G7_LITER